MEVLARILGGDLLGLLVLDGDFLDTIGDLSHLVFAIAVGSGGTGSLTGLLSLETGNLLLRLLDVLQDVLAQSHVNSEDNKKKHTFWV